MNNSKGWAIAVIALIIINISTLFVFWFSRHQPPSLEDSTQKKPLKGGAVGYLVKELKLDSNQQLAYLQLREQFQEDIHGIRKQIKEAKEAYFDLLADSLVDDAKLESYSLKTTQLEQQLDLKTFRHFQAIRHLCTPTQQQKFDSIIKTVVKQMGPPHPPNPPHPPRQGEGNEPPPPPDRERGEPRFGNEPPPHGDRPPPPREE